MFMGHHRVWSTASVCCVLILVSACGDRDLRTGRSALGQGRYQLALSHLQKAQSKGLKTPTLQRDLASAHRSLAMIAVKEKLCEQARVHIKSAESLSSPVRADHEALFRCIETGSSSAAIREAILNDLLKLGDTRAVVMRALLDVLFEQGKDHEAIALAPGLQSRFALKASDHRRLVFAFVKAQRFSEAHPHLVRAVWSTPTDPLLRLTLADTLETMDRQQDALRAYTALTRDFPSNPVVFLRLAAYLNRRGKPMEAARALEDANRLRAVRRPVRKMRPLRPSKR